MFECLRIGCQSSPPSSQEICANQLTVEATLICNIVYQQYSHCAPVVRRCNRPEPLLPRSIPYLQLHPLPVELDSPDLEVYSDCSDEGRCEGVLAEAQQAARFPYARVANEEELDKEIIVACPRHSARALCVAAVPRGVRRPKASRGCSACRGVSLCLSGSQAFGD